MQKGNRYSPLTERGKALYQCYRNAITNSKDEPVELSLEEFLDKLATYHMEGPCLWCAATRKLSDACFCRECSKNAVRPA
jgi:hypothetical protein